MAEVGVALVSMGPQPASFPISRVVAVAAATAGKTEDGDLAAPVDSEEEEARRVHRGSFPIRLALEAPAAGEAEAGLAAVTTYACTFRLTSKYPTQWWLRPAAAMGVLAGVEATVVEMVDLVAQEARRSAVRNLVAQGVSVVVVVAVDASGRACCRQES